MEQLIRETRPPAGTPPSPVPQYYNPATGEYERLEGSEGASKVEIKGTPEVTLTGTADVSDRANRKLGEVTLTGTIVPLQTTGVYPEYRILSTDPKPDAAEAGVGAVVYEVDTQTVYMSDGTDWVVQ